MNIDYTPESRYIIPGDIHGCLTELLELLDELKFNPMFDELICAGDLVERGPDSVGVIEHIMKYGTSVCGNHDHKMVKYYQHEKTKLIHKQYKNPMYLTPEKQILYDSLSIEHLEWLSTLPKKIHLEKHNLLIIHAGVLPDINPLYQPDNTYMFCRYVDATSKKQTHLGKDLKQPQNSVFWTELYNGTVDIVYGHQVHDLNEPSIQKNIYGATTYGLDTGCCFGGHLTALVVDKNSGVKYTKQVKSHNRYYQY